MSKKQEIIGLAEKIMDHIMFANGYIDVYLTIDQARVDYNEEINYAPGFFSITIMALTNSMFMETGKLIDSHRDALAFNNLISQCKANLGIFLKHDGNNLYSKKDSKVSLEEDILKIESVLCELEPVINSLRIQRNKIYAHYDKNNFLDYSNLLKEHPVSIKDFKKLLDSMSDFCNAVLHNLNATGIHPRHTNNSDLIDLLKHVKDNIHF